MKNGMLCPVALERAIVSEEVIASIVRMTRIDELGTKLSVTTTEACCEEMLYI
jgi:hypothetical protein